MIDPMLVSGLSAILFVMGLWGAFTRKNAIIVLMCLELMLNAANLQFVAAGVYHGDTAGWIYTVFAIACLLYTSPSPRDYAASRMPSSA